MDKHLNKFFGLFQNRLIELRNRWYRCTKFQERTNNLNQHVWCCGHCSCLSSYNHFQNYWDRQPSSLWFKKNLLPRAPISMLCSDFHLISSCYSFCIQHNNTVGVPISFETDCRRPEFNHWSDLYS